MYMPMATSRRRKARKETMVSVDEAPGRAVKQQMAILTDIVIRQIFRIAASEWPRLFRIEKRALPTMMQTMKHEKTIPRGVLPVSRTGVQRNTKMYMQDSRRDWQQPRSRT